jgi:hypothetical protein
MRNLEMRKTIKADFDAEQWDLYTHSMDCDEAARYLNRTLEKFVNDGNDKMTVIGKMMEEMKGLSKFGAYDSEPIYFLESVVRKIYD